MLLSNVAVGKAYETYHNKPTLVRPPKGCNSVRGVRFSGSENRLNKAFTFVQVYGKAGADLRYDEVVVYTNDAIRPSWLIVYA